VAIALTFSSTIIIVKLLSDKRETDSLHGRIALGILIVQDIVVVLAMIALSGLTGEVTHHPAMQVLLILAKGVALFVGVWIAGFFVLPRLLPLLARSTELLVLFAIAWALALAHFGDLLGFSKEVGAFLAGVALASTAYREIISAKLVSLRDFLLLFFFVELGSRVNIGALGVQVGIAIPLTLFVLLGKPLIVMIIMGMMGYRKRTSFMTGLTAAQISEFSLILIAMGASAGHIGPEAVGMVTLVGLVTIALSSYMILYSQQLYEICAPYLGIFERKAANREDVSTMLHHYGMRVDVLLFGLGRYGTNIAGHLTARGRTVLGVDFDPQAVIRWNAEGRQAVFGDAEDPDFAAMLPLSSAKWVVSSIRDPQINNAIMHALRHAGYIGNIAFTADDRVGLPEALTSGTDLLFIPFEDAAEQAVDMLFITEEQIARKTMDKLIETISEHYVVCGFGRMGQQIVKDLARQGVIAVVVEDNPEQLPRLKEHNIPHVVGNASDDDILLRAGIARAKGLIAVASSDEANVFIVLTARVLNPKLYIMARSILEENEDKLRRAGANRVMSPYILGGRRMAAAVTRPGVMDFLDLVVHSDNMDIEIGNIAVTSTLGFAGRTVEEIGLGQQYGVTLLAVRRSEKELYANPRADFTIENGDELIVMGTPAQIATAAGVISPGVTPTEMRLSEMM